MNWTTVIWDYWSQAQMNKYILYQDVDSYTEFRLIGKTKKEQILNANHHLNLDITPIVYKNNSIFDLDIER